MDEPGAPSGCACTVAEPVSVEGQVAVTGVVSVKNAIALAGPVTLQEPVHLRTADTDDTRILTGKAFALTGSNKFAEGPLIVTDLAVTNLFDLSPGQTFRAEIYLASDCGTVGPPPASSQIAVLIQAVDRHSEIHGARLRVPAGMEVCSRQIGSGGISFIWSGFRPYE
ncbi:MAG TPA: hypothetical protein VNO30_28870 [Kofleriaceae bacterium]|nr:hypothetical protein [Kofleriaceae bacterium]